MRQKIIDMSDSAVDSCSAVRAGGQHQYVITKETMYCGDHPGTVLIISPAFRTEDYIPLANPYKTGHEQLPNPCGIVYIACDHIIRFKPADERLTDWKLGFEFRSYRPWSHGKEMEKFVFRRISWSDYQENPQPILAFTQSFISWLDEQPQRHKVGLFTGDRCWG